MFWFGVRAAITVLIYGVSAHLKPRDGYFDAHTPFAVLGALVFFFGYQAARDVLGVTTEESPLLASSFIWDVMAAACWAFAVLSYVGGV